MDFKAVLADNMCPSGRFGTMFGVFYGKVKTYARLIKVGKKMHFLSVKQSGVPHGVPNVKIVENLPIKVQGPQKSIYSIPMHFKPILLPKS